MSWAGDPNGVGIPGDTFQMDAELSGVPIAMPRGAATLLLSRLKRPVQRFPAKVIDGEAVIGVDFRLLVGDEDSLVSLSAWFTDPSLYVDEFTYNALTAVLNVSAGTAGNTGGIRFRATFSSGAMTDSYVLLPVIAAPAAPFLPPSALLIGGQAITIGGELILIG